MSAIATTVFDRAASAWPDDVRLHVLEVLQASGLSKDDPVAVVAVLLGHVESAAHQIPLAIDSEAQRMAFAMAGYVKDFGAIAEELPVRTESAIRGVIQPTAAAIAGHIVPTAAVEIARQMAVLVAEQHRATEAAMAQQQQTATLAMQHIANASVAASRAQRRGATLAGFYYPVACAVLAVVIAALIFAPQVRGAAYRNAYAAGRHAQLYDDVSMARSHSASWQRTVKAGVRP